MHKTILLISPFYPPALGGVETSLYTLVTLLRRKRYRVKVISRNVNQKLFEFFEGNKFFECLYIIPWLFIKAIWYMLWNHKRISVVHGAGFMGGFVTRAIALMWFKPYVISIHAIYEGIYKLGRVEKAILGGATAVFSLSEESLKELSISNGVIYRTLIDPELFRPLRVDMSPIFTIAFVARPIAKKGWDVMKEVEKRLPQYNFKFAKNIPNSRLPFFYNSADMTVTASLYKECFSRTILESLFCGVPVIYSNKDVAVDYLDKKVAIPVEPTAESLVKAIEDYVSNPWIKKETCREYALKHYGKENLKVFTDVYNIQPKT